MLSPPDLNLLPPSTTLDRHAVSDNTIPYVLVLVLLEQLLKKASSKNIIPLSKSRTPGRGGGGEEEEPLFGDARQGSFNTIAGNEVESTSRRNKRPSQFACVLLNEHLC